MNKRIQKKKEKNILKSTTEKVYKRTIARLRYCCERQEEDVTALREENTAYKQLLHANQINLEWALKKLIGDGESISIPIAELKPDKTEALVSCKDGDNIIIKRVKVEENSPIYEENT